MGTKEYGYVVCTECGGEFHETDVEDGQCWLCRNYGLGGGVWIPTAPVV